MQAIFGSIVYTGSGVEKDCYVVYEGGKITGVTSSYNGTVEGEFDVVTPGFVDPHAHIGLIRAGEPSAEAEANDQMDSMIAHADVLDSVQMDDTAFGDSVEAGVLYTCVVPGSGNIIGGRSAVLRNYGKNTNDALIGRAGIKAALGFNPMSTQAWKGTRPFTRMGAIALLRGKLHTVREKLKKKPEDQDLGADEQVIRTLLKGRDRLRVHVHKSDDISALLRLVDEFHLRVTVEHGCDVHDTDTFRELAKRSIPVIYGPLDALAYKVELKHENWRNLRCLIESGVSYGLMTDHPVILQKTLLLELRWFLRCGLSKQQAIEVITRQNAKAIGMEKAVGTLQKGRHATAVCWNGDPFDLASYPVAVFAEGNKILEAG